MCVLSIKASIRKKSGNLFNDPRIFISTFFVYLFLVTVLSNTNNFYTDPFDL